MNERSTINFLLNNYLRGSMTRDQLEDFFMQFLEARLVDTELKGMLKGILVTICVVILFALTR